MTELEIVVEPRGPHYVAWARGEDGKPRKAMIMVGQTGEEAEARLRAWWDAHRER